MKKFLFIIFLFSAGLTGKVYAQCAVQNASFNIKNTVPVTANSCQVTFDFTFQLQNNNGNKYVCIQAWLQSDYPDYWHCSNGAPTINPKKCPKAADLKKNGTGPLPFLNIFYNNNVSPPVALTTYGPDASVPVTTGYTVSVGATSGGFTTITVQNVTVTVPQACGSATSVSADLWSAEGSSSSNASCVFCNSVYAFNYPQITAAMNCLIPRHYQVIINNINTSQTITSSWQTFIDYAPFGTFGPEDVLVDDESGNVQTITAGNSYNSGFTLNYTGNDGTTVGTDGSLVVNHNLWVVVTTVGLANTQTQLIANTCSPLAVSLMSFDATRNNSTVTLSWETSTETNNNGFAIERNTTGVWEQIGFVNSLAQGGSSTDKLDYQFVDINNFKGISQYRLREVNLTGQSKYSMIRTVRSETQIGKIIVYPNPSNDGSVNISFEQNNVPRNISIVDLSGKVVRQVNNTTDNNLKVDNLQSGLYTVRIITVESGQQAVQKFVVINH